ncbi:MAG: pilus assembly protein PilM [Nitrospinae bacterium]|nr:pilus assembly protein PilM [Nitrospinota bacterium]
MGGEGDLGAIQEVLETTLGIRVEVFEPTRFLDLTPLGGEQAEFQERAPALAIAIGLAMRRVGEHTINLLPKDLQTRRGVNSGKIAAGVAAAGFLSLLVVGHQQLSARVEPLRQTLRALEGEKSALRPRLEELQKAQQERAYVQPGLLFLEQVRWHGRFWPEMLRELSALAPKEVRFQSLEVTRVPEGYQVSLRGEAMSKDLPEAVAALTQFYPQLRKSPFFVDLLSQLPQVPAWGGNLSPAAGRPGGIRDPQADAEEMAKLDFVISGKLRLRLLFPPGLQGG